MKRKSKNKKTIGRKVWTISFFTYLIFLIYIFVVDIIPTNYLIIGAIIIFFIYFILMFFTFHRRIKKKIKTISVLLLILFIIGFGIGIKSLNDMTNFFSAIERKISQKTNYYVMVLANSNYNSISDLEEKTIGVYSSSNYNDSLESINNNSIIKKEYSDLEQMLVDLRDGTINSVLINDSIKNLISIEFENLGLELRAIKNISTSIKRDDIVKKVDISNTKFNVYIAGGDSYGSIEFTSNTDVNMVVTVDPVNNKIILTSIPRDYYVNIPSYGENAYDKLTHVGYYGIEESTKALEKLLDIDINYYVKINFSTVIGVIDAIGGIDVESDYDFCVSIAPVCFKKGKNHLDGYEAMMFARERKSFSDGDVQRVKNQQKVITSFVNKATSSTKIITNYSSILDTIKESFSTNIDSKSINKLIKKQLSDMESWTIEGQNLTGKDLYTTGTYTFPEMRLYVMEQDQNSVNEARSKIKQLLNE